MWGWRKLSPRARFADGAAYGIDGNKKILVIMTDGENQIGGNNLNGPVMSHCSAYGYMRWGRFPQENFDSAAQYLDQRMTTACSNAKLDGGQVVTILFRVKTVAAQNLLRNCACSGNLFCIARDQAALSKAFTDVAELIGRILITK